MPVPRYDEIEGEKLVNCGGMLCTFHWYEQAIIYFGRIDSVQYLTSRNFFCVAFSHYARIKFLAMYSHFNSRNRYGLVENLIKNMWKMNAIHRTTKPTNVLSSTSSMVVVVLVLLLLMVFGAGFIECKLMVELQNRGSISIYVVG